MYLCCNQLKGYWEVKKPGNQIIFTGTLKECEVYINENK